MENKEIDFIARHYRKGRFSAEAGWRRLGIAQTSWWRRFRVAAAISAAVLLSATAAVIYHRYSADEVTQHTAPVQAASPLKQIKIIDFENAPLQEVVEKIETVYAVKVGNIPESADGYVLSLHYEGNPAELIAEINEILGTQMTVTEQ